MFFGLDLLSFREVTGKLFADWRIAKLRIGTGHIASWSAMILEADRLEVEGLLVFEVGCAADLLPGAISFRELHRCSA